MFFWRKKPRKKPKRTGKPIDFCDLYIVSKGTNRVRRTIPSGTANRILIFKNCTLFSNCISETNRIQVENWKDLDPFCKCITFANV